MTATDAATMNRGTETQFGALKQTDAGLLSVGYAEVGPADGRAVILLHGWPYDIHSYAEVTPLLASAGYRVIVPYLRGYGTTRFLSDATFRNGQQSALAVDAIALMDALGIREAIIAGFDWGARTANVVAALWPDRCKAIVSVSGYLIGSPAGGTMTADDDEVDVIVVGSGAAGMTAALAAAHHGLRTVVLEKTEWFGGSTARSGGGIWAPGNEALRKVGVRDTPEQASAYLAHVAGDCVPEPRRTALLEHGPAMLAFVRARCPVNFAWVPGYADYYPEAPGGLAQGRSVEPVPLDGRVLGTELAHLNPPYLPAPRGVVITQADYRWLSLGPRHPRAILATAKMLGRMARVRLLGQRTLSMGQALAAGLRAGLAAQRVPVLLGTPMTGLHLEDGRVTGVRLIRDGQPATMRSRRGVVLAAGGFERNEEMRLRYQRQPIGTEWTTGSAGNTGDAITAGEAAGAALDLMDDAWWGPSIPLSGGPYFCLAERSLPGCILVNGAGQRFVNESAPYVDAVHAMYDGHGTGSPHIPSWLIIDQRYRNRYVFAGLPPRRPLPRRWYRAGAVYRAPTIAELAEQAGLEPTALSKTVVRFNEFAQAGRDEDFGRGDSAYDRYYGDPRCRPNPNLAPLTQAPFYAVKIVPGDLGTKGGLRTDERARVLREDGTPIPGLYAAGNTSAAVMGHSYAGAGATIGPAMTFGYIAALDLAGLSP